MIDFGFDLVGFDGDDTLWHNERDYVEARGRFSRVIDACGLDLDPETLTEAINETELKNIPFYGYGVSSFVLSLIETAIRLTGGRVSGREIAGLLDIGKAMLTSEIELFEGAREALAALAPRCPLVLITKGDLLHQRSKLDRSALAGAFAHVEVVSHKTPDVYRAILTRHGVEPSRFLMIGNSPRSDILPVLHLGGWAIHVPAALSWSHEEDEVPTGEGARCVVARSLCDVPGIVRRWTSGA